MKILLVEDSVRLQRSLSAGLKRHGFSVDQAFDGEQALTYIRHNQYDTIILDLVLPKIDGLNVLSTMRNEGKNNQVLILSANDQTEDRIRGLDLGADDYMVKPFSFDELVSRLRALNRRHSGIKNPVLDISGVKIDTVSRLVRFNERVVNLTPHEFKLLDYLAHRRGRVFSHDQLIDQLYDAASYVTRNAVEAHISSLRKRLKASGAPGLVKTRRGFGYLVE
ncbi:MAG: response regulator transcription factor [Candidatus Thiodiazotropha lotti]|uniref:DNA-binding response regulator n=1 Tax=Candidatus Thiodiazotropha endoloripes TaxID=1818881 RepID=A0A1E2USI1_9GAMM|nr:response regulator transcription factor [Candidatus Thiodiazotropha endoloripes]MCG7897485.1 response regulator transcription factor [Candidatus Thiodiazotropha weberae]MCG7990261.1 response regulator transcription factor [Candidatus Thiodiazotropha lotti]MCG7902069.1 response regulator transcription factor [Candidatus Thiodiazotropha weberae]MCG7914060.1 response regulator transcription factor [Candidatus Thiodiazotropha weberae]MCG7999102.1 response regulator transcription factor [Candida